MFLQSMDCNPEIAIRSYMALENFALLGIDISPYLKYEFHGDEKEKGALES